MMMPGAIFPFDFLAILIITVCYYLCPKAIIEKKNEYVKFLLTFLSLYFFIFLILHCMISDRGTLLALFALGFSPALLLANIVYPFKTVKRNQHLNFFLFFISLFSLGIIAVMWALVTFFSNM